MRILFFLISALVLSSKAYSWELIKECQLTCPNCSTQAGSLIIERDETYLHSDGTRDNQFIISGAAIDLMLSQNDLAKDKINPKGEFIGKLHFFGSQVQSIGPTLQNSQRIYYVFKFDNLKQSMQVVTEKRSDNSGEVIEVLGTLNFNRCHGK